MSASSLSISVVLVITYLSIGAKRQDVVNVNFLGIHPSFGYLGPF